MSNTIPESHRDLVEGPVCITLVTLMPDGRPQGTVAWCDYDGEHVLVSTARERQKAQNMLARPQATVVAIDPENPYRYLEVRGTVAAVTEEGAMDIIDRLAQLYANKPTYYGHLAPEEQKEKETRVVCKIRPEKVRAVGE
jgi:PPOX class probable F420-dependent enzyme